jgi:predicted transcriptional regulator
MPEDPTLTIRLTPDVQKKLDRLAATTHRSTSFLAAEAITNYVQREGEIVQSIEHGLADMKVGRLVQHDEAMARLDAAIEDAEREAG